MDSVSENNDIGNMLRAAREAQGVSLDDVSALLKIRSDHLEALENGDFDRLPGHVYAIGFIRTYATHLGLNAADLVSRFKEATMILPVEDGYNEGGNGEPISLGLKLGLGFFAVFLVYLMWLIAGGAGPDERNTAAVTKPESVADAPPQIERQAAKPVETPPGRPAVSPRQEADTAAPDVSEEPNAPPPAEEVTGEPIAPIGVGEAIVVAPLAAEPVEEIVAVLPAGKVEIRASRRTWMRIENTQGTVLFSSIIRDGDSFELEEDEPYTLATRDAGALHYFVDETKVGDVGRRGQILTARQIDRAAIIALQP